MNTAVTSREDILETSRRLIRDQGWQAVNIRSVASACGVSVGSIYNYFGSKSELAAAAVESVWMDIFRPADGKDSFHGFLGCVQWIYDCMKAGGRKYPGFFTLHSMSFLGEEKERGRRLMEKSFHHIREKLHAVLISDGEVRRDAFDGQFTPEKFVELVFTLILSSLLRQDYDNSAVLEVVRRSVY